MKVITLIAAFTLSACTLTHWSKYGGSNFDRQKDISACRMISLKRIPTDSSPISRELMNDKSSKGTCSDNKNEFIYYFDENEARREDMIFSCMLEKGWRLETLFFSN